MLCQQNTSKLADTATAKTSTVDEVGQYSWMIGTGFSDPNNQTSYYAAYNRTYVVVTVFGHGADVSNVADPVAELACLRPTWSALPTPTMTRKAASTSVASKTTSAVPVVTTSS